MLGANYGKHYLLPAANPVSLHTQCLDVGACTMNLSRMIVSLGEMMGSAGIEVCITKLAAFDAGHVTLYTVYQASAYRATSPFKEYWSLMYLFLSS